MSEAKRAYNLLRGYVNREWDRIKGLELAKALEELDQPSHEEPTAKEGGEPQEEVTKIIIPEGMDVKEAARKILGVDEKASFDQIRHAFEKLNRRSQPGQFPTGSEEAKSAIHLQRRVQWAYSILTVETSDSEKRFRSLEIE